jgi:hypothetical protein
VGVRPYFTTHAINSNNALTHLISARYTQVLNLLETSVCLQNKGHKPSGADKYPLWMDERFKTIASVHFNAISTTLKGVEQ